MEEKIKDFEERKKKRMEAWTKQEAIFKEEMIRRGYGHIVEQMERLEQNKKKRMDAWTEQGERFNKEMIIRGYGHILLNKQKDKD